MWWFDELVVLWKGRAHQDLWIPHIPLEWWGPNCCTWVRRIRDAQLVNLSWICLWKFRSMPLIQAVLLSEMAWIKTPIYRLHGLDLFKSYSANCYSWTTQIVHSYNIVAYDFISRRWWKDIGLAAKYPFARDRLVEGYFWILGVYFEPHYARARNIVVRMFKLASIIDDNFDVDGRFMDLKVFTDAIKRFDIMHFSFSFTCKHEK